MSFYFQFCSVGAVLIITLLLSCRGSEREPPPPAFPPPVSDQDISSSFAQGHMKPLGYQRPPVGPVPVYDEALLPGEFWKRHVKRRKPLVYQRAVVDSPAYQLWTDAYLREHYGDVDILCEVKREDRDTTPRRMTFSQFLDRYTSENIYAVTVLPDDMRKELKTPTSVLCGTFKKYLQEANYWQGSGGTRSVLHYDADHNIHCLLAGRKDFIMIEKKYEQHLFMSTMSINGSGYSQIEPDSVDLLRYPTIVDIPWSWATLNSGDCIFIPGGYLHQVRSYGRTISATVLWAPTKWFHGDDCDDANFNYTALSDVELKWTYIRGQKYIEMGYMNPEQLRHNLLSLARDFNGRITIKDFRDVYLEEIVTKDESQKSDEDVRKVWEKLTGQSEKDHLEISDIQNLSPEVLKDLARSLDPPHDGY